MLIRGDNELLTRIGPRATMGDLFRQYWHPVLIPWELKADGPPLRIRLLGGRQLLALGRLVFFGRNEAGGLRCVHQAASTSGPESACQTRTTPRHAALATE